MAQSLFFIFAFVNNASPQVVLTSTELTGATAPTVNISSRAIASGTVASVVSAGVMTYDSFTKTFGYLLTNADPTNYAYVGMAVTTYATASPKSVHAIGMVIPDVKPSTLATSTALSTAQTDLDTLTGSDGATLATAQPNVTIPTAAANADAVWDEATSGHVIVGSTGAAIVAAGAAGDPWSSALPGAYTAGTAGEIIGTIVADLAATHSLTIINVVDGGSITVTADDKWTFTLSNSSLSLTDYTELAFTVKKRLSQTDEEGMVYLRTDTGLEYVDGVAVTTTLGTLTNTATSFTGTIDESLTGVTADVYIWTLKGLAGTDGPVTLTAGSFLIQAAGVRAIT